MADPTGQSTSAPLRLDFNRRLKLEFHGSVITSDARLLAYRELDNTLGLTGMVGDVLADLRTGKNGRRLFVSLLRQSVFGRLAGYEDVNDAERLCRDPAMRWVVGDRAIEGTAASASQMSRFETEWLTRPENLAALADLTRQWIDPVHRRRPPRIVVLDMDSSESPTHGEQEGSAYNGHFSCTCYPPAVRIQPARRSGAVRATARQRALGRRLARDIGTSRVALPGQGDAVIFSRRCGLRQPGDIRIPRS